MTDIQRQALTEIVKTYAYYDGYEPDSGMWDNSHIAYALRAMFADNIITPEELSKEIMCSTHINVPPLMIGYAAKGVFIEMRRAE